MAVVPDRLVLTSGSIRAEIAPRDGGRLAQLVIDGTPLLIDHTADAAAIDWGSYPMVPWAGRIRRGQFTFDGVEHQLPINLGDHAIHGVGFTRSWAVENHGDRRASLLLAMPDDGAWPFGGIATQQLTVDDDGITMAITVTATDQAFPVSFGWHPWFRKPDSLEFHPTAMYRRDTDHIVVDEMIDVTAGPWDDCFTNTEPVVAVVDGVRLRLTSNCDIWVVYDEPPHATCIEPQTGPPDAFNIDPRRLEPGDAISAWYRIARA